MIKEIAYGEKCNFWGRNGGGLQCGIQVLDVPGFAIQLRPITSRLEPTDSARIEVSRDSLPDLIAHLQRVQAGETAPGQSEFLKAVN